MKYLFTLLILLPLTSTAQNFGIYIDPTGQVAIGKDTVWEPFQVFAEAGPQLQLDQQSVEMGNTAGLLIASTVENGQSFTCGLTGQLASVSLRLGTVIDAGNTMLDMNIREDSAPTGTILRTSSFAISDDEMQWYDIALTPFIDVMAGDEFFIEIVHTGGDQAEWDWEDGTDPYSGGTSWQNQTSWLEIVSSDFVFRTYVVSAEKSEVLSVTSTGRVKINDYLLPQFDGLNNQVMVTNGTGVLSWQEMTAGGGSALIQDADGDTKVQVEESVDEDVIRFDMAGTEYFRMEEGRLQFINTGGSVFLGPDAGPNDDLTDNYNVFVGIEAGMQNTEGSLNTAVGAGALRDNVEGHSNIAIGASALTFNTGSENIAIGNAALMHNKANERSLAIGIDAMAFTDSRTDGRPTFNTAIGYQAMRGTTIFLDGGRWNTAIGDQALHANNSGDRNTATGFRALVLNDSGADNVAYGAEALYSNIAGSRATAIGAYAMRYSRNISTSFQSNNVAVGYEALRGSEDASANTGNGNTAIGYQTLLNNTTGSNNTALGYNANSNSGDFSNSTGIGYDAEPLASNCVRIGNDSVTTIGGAVNWGILSDRRFKSDITEEVVGLDFINELRPVTYNIDLDAIQAWKAFHYNERNSSDNPGKAEIETYRFSGFIAQEVESASRKTGYDFSGVCPPKHEKDSYSLRYAEFVVPLVKAVQELSDLVGQQQQLISHLQSTVSALEGEVLLLKNEH